MAKINGSFITEIDGVKYYTDGIVKGNISISANIGYVELGINYNAVNGEITETEAFGGSGLGILLSMDSDGNLKIGASARVFDAGIIKYADGTEGVFLGGGIGNELLGLGISVDGTLNSNGNNLSSYNTIQVNANGTLVKTVFSPGTAKYPYVKVKITTYDANGNVIKTDFNNISNPDLAAAMASGMAPRMLSVAHHCFPAGTKIRLADGTEKAIEHISTNDKVASFHPEHFAGKSGLEEQRVVRLFENITDIKLKQRLNLIKRKRAA